MTGFSVDPAVLRETARSMVLVAAYLSNARATTKDLATGDFGNATLGQAARDFVEHWQWQADRIGKALVDSADRLQQAAAQYQAVEDAQLRAQTGGVV